MKISFTKDYKNSFSMIGKAIIIFSETVIPFLFKAPPTPFPAHQQCVSARRGAGVGVVMLLFDVDI